MNISQLLTDAEGALAKVSSAQWQSALQTAIKDAQNKAPLIQDALDVGAVLDPELFEGIDILYKVYVAAGGKPADVGDLVTRRKTQDPYDTEGATDD